MSTTLTTELSLLRGLISSKSQSRQNLFLKLFFFRKMARIELRKKNIVDYRLSREKNVRKYSEIRFLHFTKLHLS